MTGIYWHIKLLLVDSLRSCWSAGLAKKERDKNLDVHVRRWRQDLDFVFHAAAINNKSGSQRSLTVTRPAAQDVKDDDLSSSDDWPWRKCHWRQGVNGQTRFRPFWISYCWRNHRKMKFSRSKTNNSRITHTSGDKSRVTCIQVFTNHVSF